MTTRIKQILRFSLKKLICILFFVSTISIAHQGGKDSNGGHVNRSTGAYHCHDVGCIVPGTVNSIKITSFNIQFLGNPKNRDNSALASVVADSDIVLVQELVAPPTQGVYPDGTAYKADPEALAFFKEMADRGFTYVLSEEDTGTGDDIHKASSATEWWVAFYKEQTISIADELVADGISGFLANDRSNHDDYERVPYAFPFRMNDTGMDFVLISVHLQPKPGPSSRARRKHELESIYSWIDEHDEKEKDFIIIGDMNLYKCDVLATMELGAFITLNSNCLNTNTNVNGPEPFDHVLYRANFTGEIDLGYGFKVTNLITAMKAPWYESFTHAYPGEPYKHNPFRARFSDHNPVSFKLIASTDDD